MSPDPFVGFPAVSSGDLITCRRRDLGRSQRELADEVCDITGRATLTRHEISRYERETRIPTTAALAALAAALDLPEPWLRQAAQFATRRRHLAAGDPDRWAGLHPGYLIGTDPTRGPLPMLAFGIPPTADQPDQRGSVRRGPGLTAVAVR